MTIIIGMQCDGGVVFGADTEECVGQLRQRVHKIPTRITPPFAMIAGACDNGHLMDTAVERIMDALERENPQKGTEVSELLDRIMLGLYRRQFGVYPSTERGMDLFVALKPDKEPKAMAWSISSSSVHRLPLMEVAGSGLLIKSVADGLYAAGMSVEMGVLATLQVLSFAKKRVLGVGGESYVHVLHDPGGIDSANFNFQPQKEDLYEYFLENGRALLLATGNETVTDEQYGKLLGEFATQLKWKRNKIVNP